MITEARAAELVEALEQFIQETTLLHRDGRAMRWEDGTPCAVAVVDAMNALARLRGEPFPVLRRPAPLALDIGLKEANRP